MNKVETTQLQIRADRPTGISSSAHGSNLDAVGFNLLFIASKNPKLAIDILKLYAEAHEVQESNPNAPDEDFELFANKLKDTLLSDTENKQ